jgi:hypothetical protein
VVLAQPFLDQRPKAPASGPWLGLRKRRVELPHRELFATDLLGQMQRLDDLELG